MIFVSKISVLLVYFCLKYNFLPAPTRAISSQAVPAVGERLIKSKIIPDQARALAHALKHAVVKPLKKSMTKKKSVDIILNDQPITHSLANRSSATNENSDNLLNEISVDSLESTSPIALTPPPVKPPRHNDESGSSSPTEISSPPAKPPRHFSLYNNNKDHTLIQQTDHVVKKVLNLVDTFGIISENDNDMNILRQTSSPPIYIQQASDTSELEDQNLNNIQTNETFTVDPIKIHLNNDSQLITKPLDESLTITSPFPSTDLSLSPINELNEIQSDNNSTPNEITQLATNLTDNIFQEVEKEFEKQDILTNLNSVINNDRQNLLDKLSTQPTNNTFRDNAPSLPQSIEPIQPASGQSTTRPLMFVSLDSGFNIAKAFSPLLDIVTTKTTPKITTSVTVISPPQPEIQSTTTPNIISDDEEQLNSTSTLMPNSSIASDRSKFLQNSSKESSVDSTDTNPYDTTIPQHLNTGSATPARSLLSEYDNLHGSYGSLNDDTQHTFPFPPPPPPPLSSTSSEVIPSIPTTNSSSISTIYESLDTSPSTPTYVTAKSTLNNDATSISAISSKRINSDISDEDLVESYDIETPILTSVNPFRSFKGRIASHRIQITKHEHIYSFSWHVLTFLVSIGMIIDKHLLLLLFFFFNKNNNNKNTYLYIFYVYIT
jgi:hypothetical protein